MSEKMVLDVYTPDQVKDIRTYARFHTLNQKQPSEFAHDALSQIQKRLGMSPEQILLLAKVYGNTAEA